MRDITNQQHLLNSQYRDTTALNARIQIYRFSVNKHRFLNWIFEHYKLPEQCSILELGCGNGNLWKSNAHRIPRGWKITLTDLSPGMLEEAQRNLADTDHEFGFQVADAQSIPFDADAFDAVIANHMLYHVPDRPRAISEIRRVLRPGGKLCASTIGIGHTREMQDICNLLDPRINLDTDAVAREFGLENGEEQLKQFFDDVQRHLYDDYLLVPEAGPIVDYIMSLSDRAPLLKEYGHEALMKVVEDELSRSNPLKITKRTGIFVAY